MNQVDLYLQRARLLHRGGNSREAANSYRQALQLQPDHPWALYELGALLLRARQPADALPLLLRAEQIPPPRFEVQFALGGALIALGRFAEAEAALNYAVRLRPEAAEAYHCLAGTQHPRGRREEARRNLRKAIALKPDLTVAYINLAAIECELNDFAEATTCLQRAAAYEPGAVSVLMPLAYVLQQSSRLREAEDVLRRIIAAHPECVPAYSNLGAVLQAVGRSAEAVELCLKAVALAPNDADVHYRLGKTLLSAGRFEEGWPEHEWWLGTRERLPREFVTPKWNGEAIAGKTLLVHADKGFGDTIQFCRYLPLVKARSRTRVIFECRSELISLLRSCEGIDAITPRNSDYAPPDEIYDAQIGLMSLPGLFGTRLETIPDTVPYLTVPEDALRRARVRFGGDGGFKAGLVWAGSPAHQSDHERSCDLTAFALPGSVPDVRFYSLQKGNRAAQAANPPGDMKLIRLSEGFDDFADTAAAMLCLDLVITTCTSTAHLAGALGVQVWTLLSYNADWRWLQDREDSPWYPSMRLFRQPAPRDWQSVMARVAWELTNIAHHGRRHA